jgi:DNA-binding response OmpR family regulator
MKKIILAVDDDEVFLKTLRDVMEEDGYEVKTLSDPTRTEEFMEKYRPGLLIVDVFMPVKSGFNILEDFNDKGKYGDVPKIFLTALDDEVEKMTARACGAEYYVTKPFKPGDLLRIVRDVLGDAGE